MKLENQVILVVSNEPWGDIWFSKHNYAFELSKKNTVYFIDPTEKWEFKNLLFPEIKIKKIKDRLFVIKYTNVLPALNFFLIKINNFIVSYLLKRFIDKSAKAQCILWNFDTCRFYDGKLLNSKISIFHSVDEHNFRHPSEKLLAQKADFIFCISKEFVKTYLPYNKSVFIVPHGISSEEFSVTETELNNLDIPYKNYGLYVGNIDERMDLQQLEMVLMNFPETDFVFVGKNNVQGKDPLERKIFLEKYYKNIHLIGPRHFKQLKPYIAASKFCIAFMTDQHWGNRISHHKIFQYLAFGKPVFSCNFSEYEDAGHLLYMNDDKNILNAKLLHFLQNGENENLKNERINYARQHSFEEIFNKAEQIINSSNSLS